MHEDARFEGWVMGVSCVFAAELSNTDYAGGGSGYLGCLRKDGMMI